MDPTNPLSVAPPRYKYHPSPETITNFPEYRTESDVDVSDEAEQDLTDEGSDFSDEEDRLPNVKTARKLPIYGEQDVKILWRKVHDAGTLDRVTKTLVAVNQVAIVLSQALENPRNRSAESHSMIKVGYVTLQQPTISRNDKKSQPSPRKVFALWLNPSTTSIIMAIQVGRVSDRAVHIVCEALTEVVTRQNDAERTLAILDTYIPQTYVPSMRPEARLYLDTPPIRLLSAKKSTSVIQREGIEKFESPNYVTGISAGMLACSADRSSESTLFLLPKPFDGHAIIQAIKAAPGFQPASEQVKAALKAADMDWEEVHSSSTGHRRSGRKGNSRPHGIIGDGGMYV
ncbi:hypothetical protein NliqN6_1485 [Naganishia liquefaciens]|uniref:Uncharacterized protein n=1 Tax=Naganishia liquefaciens TaxID=104408 RepID=A0A8H3TQJ9_9TREE|nr:hypothetical protein NliqN6_1485 [Naganishia liquefaciens]